MAMTKKEKEWSERVAAWRASGLSSEAFSAGREFTAGGLRHWAYRLRRRRRSVSARPPGVRLARVVVRTSDEDQAARGCAEPAATAAGAAGVALEVGRVRIALERRFDREALSVVLSVLGAGGAR